MVFILVHTVNKNQVTNVHEVPSSMGIKLDFRVSIIYFPVVMVDLSKSHNANPVCQKSLRQSRDELQGGSVNGKAHEVCT
jgi:hypothetical protein